MQKKRISVEPEEEFKTHHDKIMHESGADFNVHVDPKSWYSENFD